MIEHVYVRGSRRTARTAMLSAERQSRAWWRKIGAPRKVRALSAERRHNVEGYWWSVTIEILPIA